VPDFLPTKDAALLSWSANFNTLIGLTPEAFGLVAADATAYNTKHLAFVAALTTSTEPNTRTHPAILATKAKRRELTDMARDLSKRIQGTPSVTDAQKASLGLDVKAPPTPVHAPTDAPVAEVDEMNGWLAKFKVRPAGSEGRSSLAPEAKMIHIYSYVGATPPANVNDYKFEGVSSRAIFEVQFDPELAVGTKVFVCCNWVTGRGLTSPACSPIGLVIGGGVPDVMAG
jgi:hypothetical protein